MGAIPADANYEPAENNRECCGTCEYFQGGYCSMFKTDVGEQMVCDEWEAKNVEKAEPVTLRLAVAGVQQHPSGRNVYRLQSRDGRYVGRSNPTGVRAGRHDVLTIVPDQFRRAEDEGFTWVNPRVDSLHEGNADTWRALEALAGGALASGELEKDAPPPPPPAGSQDTSGAPTGGDGPTVDDVHVNRPLDNISIAYFGRQTGRRRDDRLDFWKAFGEKQLVYGVVLEPHTVDSQGDFESPGDIEQAAHAYLKKVIGRGGQAHKLQHNQTLRDDQIIPVESFIAPIDFTYDGQEYVKKGSWVLVAHVPDKRLWQQIKDEDLTGWSVGGTGRRRSMLKPTRQSG